MTVIMKRQLNDEEKAIILKRHGRICFANGHKIPEAGKINFDHIHAHALDGQTELDNIAPMCEHHNKAKGMLPLFDYRIKLRLETFFSEGKRLTLRNLLDHMKKKGDIDSYGESVATEIHDDRIELENHGISDQFQLQTCPRTGWKYFYGNLPISILNSDDDAEHMGLQPRYLIFKKVFEMFRHFQHYPVLQPSIGRVFKNNILLFDGQHKAAALLWSGQRKFECKIYINPDLRILNQANISAHDKFAQTRFFSSILILKLGSQFGNDFDEYRNRDDIEKKNESGFLQFLEQKDTSLTRPERNKRFRSYLYKSILEDETNKLKPYISTSNRSSHEQPLTVDMLSKSILACFLYTKPLDDDMLSDKYKRESEFKNVIALMNMIYDLALSSWNPTASVNDQNQICLNRIFSSKSIMAWSELFHDSVCAKLEIHDSDDKEKPFYRDLTDDDFLKIKQCLSRLLNWQMWKAPRGTEIEASLAGNKSYLKDWLKNKGLTTGFIMGASE